VVGTAMEEYRKSLKKTEEFAFLNYCVNALKESEEDAWHFRMRDDSALMEDVSFDDIEAFVIFREMYLTGQKTFLCFDLVSVDAGDPEDESATLFTLRRL